MIPVPLTSLLVQFPTSEALRREVRDPVILWEAAPGTAFHLGEEGPTKAGVDLGPTVEDPLVFLLTRELSRPGSAGELIIGRSDECHLVVNHVTVSRAHAKLDRDPVTKRWRLTDLGSRLGTKVEGIRLLKGSPELLMDRIHLAVGDVTLQFLQPASFIFFIEKLMGTGN